MLGLELKVQGAGFRVQPSGLRGYIVGVGRVWGYSVGV